MNNRLKFFGFSSYLFLCNFLSKYVYQKGVISEYGEGK